MTGGLPSASGLQLAAACPGSFALAHIGHLTAAANSGTDKHKVFESDPARATKVMADVGLAPPHGATVRQEAAFSYHVDFSEVRFLGYGRSAYAGAEIGPREIPGTLDYLAQAPGEAVVGDFKFGRPEFVHPAKSAYQLGFAALVSARPRVRAGFVFAADESEAWADRAPEWDDFDLNDWRQRMRRLAEKVHEAHAAVARGEQPELNTGAHCTYCPAKNGCPAHVGLIKEALGLDMQDLNARISELLPDQAGAALDKVDAYLRPLQQLRGTILGYARGTPIPRANGKVLAQIKNEQERVVNADAAWKIIADRYGEEAANEACTLKSSWSAITEATRAVRKRGDIKSMREEMEAAGAIRTVELKPTLKEVRPDDPRIVLASDERPGLPEADDEAA